MEWKQLFRIRPDVQVVGFLVILLGCFAAGLLGNLVTMPELPGWYAQLAKPSWTPPDAIFGPVWSLLYLMMATAAWLIWRQGGLVHGWVPLGLFAVQLVLNSLWSILFFKLQRPGWAAVEIVVLWLAIFVTMLVFSQRSTLAGLLLLPYLVWVGFASLLNWAIWQMNA